MIVGITGHQRFENVGALGWVEQRMREELRTCEELSGLSSLAKGADQLFAELILELGGKVDAVLPFAGYEETFESPADLDGYRSLLKRCRDVITLDFAGTPERSYLAAGKYVVDHSELLIAVWDGKPAAGIGGTADIVGYAQRGDRSIFLINPETRTANLVQHGIRRDSDKKNEG